MLHALSVACATAAVLCMGLAALGLVTGRGSARAGFALRAGAVVFFAAAVALNVAAD